jgi:hypothetical protein
MRSSAATYEDSLRSATNLLTSEREKVACKLTPLAIVDHKHAIPDANWGGVTVSEPGILTHGELDLVPLPAISTVASHRDGCYGILCCRSD